MGDEARLEQQVLGRVARKRQLGHEQEVRALRERCAGGIHDEIDIAGDVTDRDVEPIDGGHLGIDGTKGTHDVAVQPRPIVHRT